MTANEDWKDAELDEIEKLCTPPVKYLQTNHKRCDIHDAIIVMYDTAYCSQVAAKAVTCTSRLKFRISTANSATQTFQSFVKEYSLRFCGTKFFKNFFG